MLPGIRESAHTKAIFQISSFIGRFWPSLLVHSVLHCSDRGFLLLIETAEKIASKRTYYHHERIAVRYTSHKLT